MREKARQILIVSNEELFHDAENANKFANILMPVLGNIGNILYVAVALTGGILLLSKAPNLSISGMAIGISIVVPFLKYDKAVCGKYQPGVKSGQFSCNGTCRCRPYFYIDR